VDLLTHWFHLILIKWGVIVLWWRGY
jgi:hypothetical protein